MPATGQMIDNDIILSSTAVKKASLLTTLIAVVVIKVFNIFRAKFCKKWYK